MMQLKKTVAAVALGLGLSASAHAWYLGELSFSNPVTVIGWGTSNLELAGFDGWHTFTVASDVFAADVTFTPWGHFNWDPGQPAYLGYRVSLYEGSNVGNDPNWFSTEGVYVDSFYADGSTTGNFHFDPSTEYTLRFLIEESNPPIFRGNGGYDLIITAVPIPEPETWAMLLAGLGIVGAVTRRKV
jgi:hypothetical protein